MRHPDPDRLLASVSRSQWLEWIQYMEIRGPIGPHRDDTYAAMISMYSMASRLQQPGTDISLADFAPPWAQPDPTDDTDDD
jgi:type II secretory pathway component PulM